MPPVPDEAQLSNCDITEFVNGMKTVASLAVFNKTGSSDSSAAMQCLAMLRPEIIIPPLLDMYALDTLIVIIVIVIIRFVLHLLVGRVAQLAERRSLAGELTLSCARPSADG